jgi:hypothetical protein
MTKTQTESKISNTRGIKAHGNIINSWKGRTSEINERNLDCALQRKKSIRTIQSEFSLA